MDKIVKNSKALDLKRAEAKKKAEEKARKENKELAEKFEKNEKKRNEKIQRKFNEKRRHERMVFQNDQKHYFEQRNMSMTRKREEDDEVNKALFKFEEHMRK